MKTEISTTLTILADLDEAGAEATAAHITGLLQAALKKASADDRMTPEGIDENSVELEAMVTGVRDVSEEVAIFEQIKDALITSCDEHTYFLPDGKGSLAGLWRGDEVEVIDNRLDLLSVSDWEGYQAKDVIGMRLADKHFGTDTSELQNHWINDSPELAAEVAELEKQQFIDLRKTHGINRQCVEIVKGDDGSSYLMLKHNRS